MKAAIVRAMAVFIPFALMFDSGNHFGMQHVAILMILCLALPELKARTSKILCVSYCTLMALIIISSTRSAVEGVALSNIIPWIITLLLFPLFRAASRRLGMRDSDFIIAGVLFSALVIFVFFARLYAISAAMPFADQLTSGASGFFNEKKAFFSAALPVVYFQGTLNLVFVSLLAASRGQIPSTFLMIVALIVAPSRFGVAVVSFGITSVFVKRVWREHGSRAAPYLRVLMLTSALALLGVSVLWVIFYAPSQAIGAGGSVRIGHLISIESVLDSNFLNALFGMGPGTSFYSEGFHAFTKNVEVSQLGVIRKFGVLGFIALHVWLIIAVLKISKQDYRRKAFVSAGHYVASLSNPVLLSAPFIFYLASSQSLYRCADRS